MNKALRLAITSSIGTQSALSKLTGIDKSRISEIVNEIRPVRYVEKEKIAKALHSTVEELFDPTCLDAVDTRSTSALFPHSRLPTNAEQAIIATLINYCPVAVFQTFNKALNERGLSFNIIHDLDLTKGGSST